MFPLFFGSAFDSIKVKYMIIDDIAKANDDNTPKMGESSFHPSMARRRFLRNGSEPLSLNPPPRRPGHPSGGDQEVLGDLRGKRAAGNGSHVGEGVDVVAEEGLALAEDN